MPGRNSLEVHFTADYHRVLCLSQLVHLFKADGIDLVIHIYTSTSTKDVSSDMRNARIGKEYISESLLLPCIIIVKKLCRSGLNYR